MADLIINDANWEAVCFDALNDNEHLCGTLPRNWHEVPYGSLHGVPAFGSDIPIIPYEEWPDRIADQERHRSSLAHVWEDSGIGVWDQNPLPYCHSYSAVMAVAIQRAVQGLPYVELSPSSVGGPVTGYRSRGAYIHDCLQQMVRVGVATTAFVPARTYQRAHFKAGWEQDAAKHRVTEWWDVPARSHAVHGSLLLSGYPVCVGLNFWRHAVLDLRVVDKDRTLRYDNPLRYGFDFLNSWGVRWGNRGRAIRMGQKALADAIYTPRQIVS